MERPLLRETATFFLRRLVRDLREGIDIRAQGHGRPVLEQAALYTWALLRDIARIPLHDPRGIGQARFRARVQFLGEVARPTLEFFDSHYPFSEAARQRIALCQEHLARGEALLRDGPIPSLDEWYATIEEFHDLTRECEGAAAALEDLVRMLDTPEGWAPGEPAAVTEPPLPS